MKQWVWAKTAATMSALVLFSAVSGCTTNTPSPVSGGASDALVTLATTGNPDPLQVERGGTIVTSDALQKKVGGLLDLTKGEHLAPKALITPAGETYAMVAPTITKDNFVRVDSNGKAMRMDVGVYRRSPHALRCQANRRGWRYALVHAILALDRQSVVISHWQ